MYMRKSGNKVVLVVILVVLVGAILFFWASWTKGESLHKEEIYHTIAQKNGSVVKITEVKLEDTPFTATMESRKGRRGNDTTFYQIIYVINGSEHIAWFRGVNGPYTQNRETTDAYGDVIEEIPENKSIIKEYGKRWIFDE
ncbi:hypothetical protein [Paenibacillus sp. NEAU-GSW1]|uniref:hypothetical protein n=1 Tax=Paenibacillus sp. NEAU-GSW1 TaxID=2682486 RepID=UPI0012E30F57|nr:hypothetical protein [Paenibacillus sp. NEAU-GSW1]MUT64879.1 hypothetical protein [Paenibacillus sp. NEAU-GSW1]